jgi:hypothetical protein
MGLLSSDDGLHLYDDQTAAKSTTHRGFTAHLQEERNALPVPASRPDDARVGNVGLAEPLDEMARIGEGVDVVPGSGAAR